MLCGLCCVIPLATFTMAAVPAAGAATFEPRGEVAHRIEIIHQRFLHGQTPEFTKDFVLADVMLCPDYPRRFANYSGDLSGRYIEAMSRLPLPDAAPAFRDLVQDLLQYQKPDGRFGNATLKYTPEEIQLDHMALLWGNGRLLVGLLAYHAAYGDPRVLDAAKRLGEFLLTVRASCADTRVAQRVNDLGAAGMICLTQLIEGLTPLAQATGESRYLDAAEQIVPWFSKERGTQHSHGYLTTLRALLLLHTATHKPEYLRMVEELYGGLVNSPDYLIYGGVREYFGAKGDRDEGCSEGDFVRLSLELWRITGRLDYLERAERCLLNQFYSNQFATGDFGHHLLAARGMAPCVGVGRAWWCCTMHGLRTLRDVLDAAVTVRDGTVRINLFLDGSWSETDRALELAYDVNGPNPKLSIGVKQASASGVPVAVRRPTWADAVTVLMNGQPLAPEEKDGYLWIAAPLRQNDRVEVSFAPRLSLVTREGKALTPEQLSETTVEAALFRGPWLLGVDEADNLLFYGEPWDENQVLLPRAPKCGDGAEGPMRVPCAHVSCEYTHGGFPGKHPLTLRPIAERTTHEPATFAVWLKFRKEP
jgi:DUF1680 family protein